MSFCSFISFFCCSSVSSLPALAATLATPPRLNPFLLENAEDSRLVIVVLFWCSLHELAGKMLLPVNCRLKKGSKLAYQPRQYKCKECTFSAKTAVCVCLLAVFGATLLVLTVTAASLQLKL